MKHSKGLALEAGWRAVGLLSILPALFFAGCETVAKPPATVPLAVKLPTVVPAGGTQEAQIKEGVEIAIAPVACKAVKRLKYAVKRASKTSDTGMMTVASRSVGEKGESGQSLVFVEETMTPFAEVLPPRMQFAVRITNNLDRPLLGRSLAVQFNVGGQPVQADRVECGQLLNGEIPAHGEAQFTVYGPLHEQLPDNGVVAFSINDVVTAVDKAGAAVTKQNFLWEFEYSTKLLTEEAKIETYRRYVSPEQFGECLAQAKKRHMESFTTVWETQ